MDSSFEVSIAGKSIPCRFLDDVGTQWWINKLRHLPGVKVREIGASRESRPLYGLKIGTGPLSCSIVAGAHADEPAGPMAACIYACTLESAFLDKYTYYIVPQVNPDGAEANKAWFAPTPDIQTYLRHVRREGPGDDIEFGYPGEGRTALRPENAAVAEFLSQGAPFDFHASLHSMGMAEGAWFLIGKDWVDRTASLQQALANKASQLGFALHDIQRHGDKGFTRIAPGFCTTPESVAMREHFLKLGDKKTAEKFHLNSMEYIQSLGGDPLVMVSEIPNFAITESWKPAPVQQISLDTPAPEPGQTRYEKSRDEIKKRLEAGDLQAAVRVAKEYGVVPVPFATHVSIQVAMLDAALSFISPK